MVEVYVGNECKIVRCVPMLCPSPTTIISMHRPFAAKKIVLVSFKFATAYFAVICGTQHHLSWKLCIPFSRSNWKLKTTFSITTTISPPISMFFSYFLLTSSRVRLFMYTIHIKSIHRMYSTSLTHTITITSSMHLYQARARLCCCCYCCCYFCCWLFCLFVMREWVMTMWNCVCIWHISLH